MSQAQSSIPNSGTGTASAHLTGDVQRSLICSLMLLRVVQHVLSLCPSVL